MRTVIPYTTTREIGQLSGDPDDRFRLELRTVKWNGRAEKFDLREWEHGKDGERPLKGLTLTAEEVAKLKTLLNSLDDNQNEGQQASLPGQLSLFSEAAL